MKRKAARQRRQPAAVTHIKDLMPDPHNARPHNPKNLGMIADSLRAVGAAHVTQGCKLLPN